MSRGTSKEVNAYVPAETRFERQTMPVPESGCWLWIGSGPATVPGNERGSIMVNGKRWYAHRYAYHTHIGPIPKGMSVLHKCDVSLCCNPAHLFLGTQKDNMRDCVKKGRLSERRGERNPKAKLTVEQVKEILSSEQSNAALGRKYGVSTTAVWCIKQRISWKGLEV